MSDKGSFWVLTVIAITSTVFQTQMPRSATGLDPVCYVATGLIGLDGIIKLEFLIWTIVALRRTPSLNADWEDDQADLQDAQEQHAENQCGHPQSLMAKSVRG